MADVFWDEENYIGPHGTKLTILKLGDLIYITPDWGPCIGFAREDFEAFVEYWNSRETEGDPG